MQQDRREDNLKNPKLQVNVFCTEQPRTKVCSGWWHVCAGVPAPEMEGHLGEERGPPI